MPQATPPASKPVDPATLMPALESRIYELVGEERKSLSPSSLPLALDPKLAAVAREKSSDMAAQGYAAHLAPSGETTSAMLMAKDARFAGMLGEEIAAQPYLPQYGVQVEAFARHIVSIWLGSEAHRTMLTDPRFVSTGIGASANGNTIYVTELLAAPLNTDHERRPIR